MKEQLVDEIFGRHMASGRVDGFWRVRAGQRSILIPCPFALYQAFTDYEQLESIFIVQAHSKSDMASRC